MSDDTTSPARNPRFAAGPADLMRRINASIGVDKRLWREDIAASRAHAKMLGAQSIIPPADAAAIERGLAQIADEYEREGVPENEALEDIHMHIEARLAQIAGADAAGRLHTARSRNDQVATAFRLWVRTAIDDGDTAIANLQRALVGQAEAHAATIMPGMTHMQFAQPVTLGHHLLAYYEMLERDRARFADARKRANLCPLGAAALAGTAFRIDREAVATELGFDAPCANSIDAVSDRDFALEYLAAAAMTALHLSRLAEELVVWASPLFGWLILPDQWSTGSSIMPQKRNPDAAELVRGHCGRIAGALVALIVTMKGLPLGYAKDMQDDKPPVLEARDLLIISLEAMAGMIAAAGFDTKRMADAAGQSFTTATDLADWLVREKGMPFREAHHQVGRAVAQAEANGTALEQEGCDLLTPQASAASRNCVGGTSPDRVREAVKAAKRKLRP